MANEATVQSSLQIKSGNLEYNSRPSGFKADINTAKGPTPGAITVTDDGTDVDLSELTTPGLCRLMNLDASYDIQVGRYDPVTDRFYPLIRVKPGESYVIRLDPDVLEEYTGTGTMDQASDSTLRIKAVGVASAFAVVEAFED